MTEPVFRTAKVLQSGPTLVAKRFDDVRKGDIFVLIEGNGEPLDPHAAIAEEDAQYADPPACGRIKITMLPLTMDKVCTIYGPCERAGFTHGEIVEGLRCAAKFRAAKEKARE